MTTSISSGDNANIEKPIFIVGAPRSGTSFLSGVIGRHRDVGFIPEPRLTWRYGNDTKSDMLHVEHARQEVKGHIRKTFAQQLQSQGKSRLVEKTPSNALRVDFIRAVFPDCRIVHIMRHGMDSTLSIRKYWQDYAAGINPTKFRKNVIRQRWKELGWSRTPYYAKELMRRVMPSWMSPVAGKPVWGPRIPGLDRLVQDLDLLEVCCLQWRMCVESACYAGRDMPANQYMECRLEDMSADMIQSILRFCDLDEDPSVLAYLQERFDPNKPGARKTQIEPNEKRVILRWIEPTLRWLGYNT